MAHGRFAPRDVTRDGAEHFESQIFADDAIFIEPQMGQRLENVVICWEHICCKILGPSSINRDKLDEEGRWQESHIISGFSVNVELLTIELPEVKMMNAREVVMENMIGPGNRVVSVKCIQTLRGLLNHWRYANKFWHHFAAPVNGLLAYSDSTNTRIRCDNRQLWLSFWNLVMFLRS